MLLGPMPAEEGRGRCDEILEEARDNGSRALVGSVLAVRAGLHAMLDRFEALRVEQSYNPVWSPDGGTILFSHLELTPSGEFVSGLQTIQPDGTGQRWLSFDDEHQADWGTAAPRVSA